MFGKNSESSEIDKVEIPSSWFLFGFVLSSIGIIILMKLYFDVGIFMTILAILITFVLGMVACRVTGETDITPVGALGKITQLSYGVLIPKNMVANLMTASITADVAGSAADLLEDLKKNMLALDFSATLESARAIKDASGDIDINEGVQVISDSLQVVGKKFQEGEWYLAELVIAGEIAKEVMALFSPLLKKDAGQSLGKVVVGTVAGDLHDLGKNIFINHAQNAGFDIIDLGVDVKTETFVQAVRDYGPVALGMSCLLTSTEKELGKVIEALKAENLRDGVKVIIGGAALTAEVSGGIGADAFAPDAITGTDIIKTWVR